MEPIIDIDKPIATPKPHTSSAKSKANGHATIEKPKNTNLITSLDDLRLSDQDYENSVGVKVFTTIRVGKPDRQTFVRVNPAPTSRLPIALLEMREDREVFAIAPALKSQLASETTKVELYSAITSQGVFFFWPVKIPGADGRPNLWHTSAIAAAQEAMVHWVRVGANMSARAYDVTKAVEAIPEPIWPEGSLLALVQLAFKDRYITALDHPAVRRLRGGL